MSNRLRVETSWINLVNGVSQEEAPGLGHIGPGFRLPIGPDKGTLYILVESLRGPQPDVERQVVDAIAEAYRRAPLGSITMALRQALTVANRQLYQANQAALSDQKIAVGVTCAVLRGADLFLAQAGPALAYMVHKGDLQRIPTDSPWLSQARAPTTPISAPLGALSETDPLLVHFFLEPGDWLLLCSSILVRYAAEEEIRAAVMQGNPQTLVQALEQLARGRDLVALAIAVTSADAEAVSTGEVAPPATVPAPAPKGAGAYERARVALTEVGRKLRDAVKAHLIALAARVDRRRKPPREVTPSPKIVPPPEEAPTPIPKAAEGTPPFRERLGQSMVVRILSYLVLLCALLLLLVICSILPVSRKVSGPASRTPTMLVIPVISPSVSPTLTTTAQPTHIPLPTQYIVGTSTPSATSVVIPITTPTQSTLVTPMPSVTRVARPTPTSPPYPRVIIAKVVIPSESTFADGDEYVVLLNPSDRIDMNGWTISDEQGITYMFFNFILNDMSVVRVHSGRGQDTQTDLFWGITSPFWGSRKSGKVVLQDNTGAHVDVLTYVTPER